MSDTFFILGIFGFVFLLWLSGGGPNRPLSFAGPVLRGSNSLYIQTPGTLYTSTSTGAGSRFGSSNIFGETPSAAAFGTPSTHRGTVTLSHYVSDAAATDPAHEYVTIRLSSDASAPVDISGWRLVSDTSGASATIPKGTEVPRSGLINATQPIVLNPGDLATVSSGRSPIGASFRENLCIGYFAQYQPFYPPLPITCPTPYDELKSYYGENPERDTACIAYTQGLNRCTLVATPPVNLSGTCASFLTTHINYHGCVNAHENDPHFKGITWRVYLGRDKSMWHKQYEVVRLLDADGKTVDMFSY
ncbi:MAG TPA: hypothetical protein VF829_00245 [Candidatus Paceibacterota bacterium]